jgi:hypothetical protein
LITFKTFAMARAFTTTFFYNGKIYTAVISQINGSLTIYIPDETLHSLLPDGRISFNPQQGIKIDTPQLSPAQDLLISILSVIETQHSEVLQGKKEQQQ